jgi:hypothetical protein
VGEVITRPANLMEIRREARRYPAYLLPHGGTGLALFSAGFWGWNDVIHMVRANMRVSCVDTDQDKLWQMAELYPEGWSFYAMDAWEFARGYAGAERWDVVTVDPWTQTIPAALETLPLWCELAERLVTVGCMMDDPLPPIPDGWESSVFPRNSNVGWLVLRRT